MILRTNIQGSFPFRKMKSLNQIIEHLFKNPILIYKMTEHYYYISLNKMKKIVEEEEKRMKIYKRSPTPEQLQKEKE